MMVPLTRTRMTAASRIMLPVYPVLSGYIAACYLLGPASRTQSPAFDAAKSLMSIRAWGVIFFAVCLLLLVGYARRSRDVTVFVLYMAAMMFALWAMFFTVSVLNTDQASLVAPAWPAFVAFACCASAVSVAKREGVPRGTE